MKTKTILAVGILCIVALFCFFLDPTYAMVSATVLGVGVVMSSSEIREELENGVTRIEAILSLAKDEERDLTEEEQKEVDAFHGSGDDDGEFKRLEAKLKKTEEIEERQRSIAKNRLKPDLENHVDKHQTDGAGRKTFSVPAQAKRHGNLEAFKGENAEKDAYISGHHAAAYLFGNEKSKQWLDDHGIQAAMSEDDNSKGGYFVPVEMESTIIRLVEQYGVFRSMSSRTPMKYKTKTVPVRKRGLVAHPVGETTTANQGNNKGTESDPLWSNIELIARKWKVVTRMSDELDEDSLIQLADELAKEAALAFAIAEDQAGFLGDGTSAYHKIKGLASSLKAGSVYTALSGNTSFATLDLADFETMMGKLPDYPGIQPYWHITKEGFYASMARLINAGAGSSKDIVDGPTPMFQGIPVKFNQVTNKNLAAQPSKRLLYLGDLNMATKFGDRRGVTMSISDEAHWDEDQIGVKWTERFDINVHSQGDDSEAGAIIALETPGS